MQYSVLLHLGIITLFKKMFYSGLVLNLIFKKRERELTANNKEF